MHVHLHACASSCLNYDSIEGLHACSQTVMHACMQVHTINYRRHADAKYHAFIITYSV